MMKIIKNKNKKIKNVAEITILHHRISAINQSFSMEFSSAVVHLKRFSNNN